MGGGGGGEGGQCCKRKNNVEMPLSGAAVSSHVTVNKSTNEKTRDCQLTDWANQQRWNADHLLIIKSNK